MKNHADPDTQTTHRAAAADRTPARAAAAQAPGNPREAAQRLRIQAAFGFPVQKVDEEEETKAADLPEWVRAGYAESGGAGGTGGKFDKDFESQQVGNSDTLKKIKDQKILVKFQNDVSTEALDSLRNNGAEMQELFPQHPKKVATATARLAENAGGLNNFAAHQAPPGNPERVAHMVARAKIPSPATLFTSAEIEAHLGKFASGAHAFIDIETSNKILGTVKDLRFKGWGVDANFVAPLEEANALNEKAQAKEGIVTLEEELGIPRGNWSSKERNPLKQLVRWIIPKPRLKEEDAETGGVLLSMATGREVGADPKAWVAGGYTKGGLHEAKIDAILREDLITLLDRNEIKTKIEKYPKTPDKI